ncbi:MAG: cytochrome c oxidase assembly protein [Armatimonadota bacterium]|nr:cytochrome c oxidase assembly protein [Armatimonadota bacterium]MDR7404942.1 cytochrome c oxidase assembly protein [Armatimonadota bacterium]
MSGFVFLHTPVSPNLAEWVRRVDLLLFLALLEAVYVGGWWVLRTRGHTRVAGGGPLARSLLGFAFLVMALVSPFETWQRYSFAAHMLQHELLMLAAPLFLSARPMPMSLWGLPGQWRKRLGAVLAAGRPVRVLVDFLLHPWVALAASLLILWTWHLPPLYNGVQASRLLHDFQHTNFFASGLLLWWPIIRAAPYRYRWSQAEGILYGLVAYVLVAMTLRSLLGAYFTLTDRPVYAYYVGVLGPRALEDQRLAGLVMWLVPLPIFIGAALSAVWPGRPQRVLPQPAARAGSSTCAYQPTGGGEG